MGYQILRITRILQDLFRIGTAEWGYVGHSEVRELSDG
jgi:hypothetical protein